MSCNLEEKQYLDLIKNIIENGMITYENVKLLMYLKDTNKVKIKIKNIKNIP
jgi:hypothetical protein